MKSKTIHIPGLPNTPEPSNLSAIAASIKHPGVIKVGVTTTEKGDWALLIGVKKGVKTPLMDIKDKLSGFPAIYQEESSELPIARPAFPKFKK